MSRRIPKITTLDLHEVNLVLSIIDEELGKLSSSGGRSKTMDGDLDMGGKKIANVDEITFQRVGTLSARLKKLVSGAGTTAISIQDPAVPSDPEAQPLQADLVANTLPDIVAALNDIHVLLSDLVSALEKRIDL